MIKRISTLAVLLLGAAIAVGSHIPIGPHSIEISIETVLVAVAIWLSVLSLAACGMAWLFIQVRGRQGRHR